MSSLVFILFTIYAIYALSRHQQFLTAGYDLGIFSQVVASYANLEAPIVPLKGPEFHILGDHFHPILMLLAPLWALFPTPETLLITQAFLVALSIIPVWLFTRSRVGLWPTIAITVAYSVSWPIQGLIDFDFHEVAFAIPFLAWAIYLYGRNRFGLALICASGLLLVREDMFVIVLAFCFLLALKRKYLLAGIGGGIALAGYVVAMIIVIPAFSPSGGYLYWSLGSFGDSPSEALLSMLSDPARMLATLVTPSEKVITLLLIFAPVAFLSLFSPYVFLAAPLILQRFLSDREVYWGTEFHYSAILAPIIFMAGVDGFSRIRSHLSPHWSSHVPLFSGDTALGVYSVAFVVLGILFSSALFPFQRLATAQAFEKDERGLAIAEVIETIPENVCVEADERIIPQILPSRTVSLPTWQDGQATWLILDLSQSEPGAYLPSPETLLHKYVLDGWVLATRSGPIVALRMPIVPESGCAPPWSENWTFSPQGTQKSPERLELSRVGQ